MRRSLVRTAVVAAIAFPLVLPGGPIASARDERPRGQLARVTMPGGTVNRFRPARLTIDRGDRVRWVNNDSVTHTTTSNDNDWNARVAPGDTFTRRFRQAGTFRYRCTIHPEMVGTIVVE